MAQTDTYLQPGYLFRRGHQNSTAAFNSVVNGHDITPVQMFSLIYIRDNPGIDATRLSNMVRFDRTTIGHVLGRFEQKELIRRQEGINDKRTKSLQIARKGEDLLDEPIQLTPEIADVVLEPLTRDERKDLHRLLDKLDENTRNNLQSAFGLSDQISLTVCFLIAYCQMRCEPGWLGWEEHEEEDQ